jgi:hypothetical protein
VPRVVWSLRFIDGSISFVGHGGKAVMMRKGQNNARHIVWAISESFFFVFFYILNDMFRYY